MSSSTVAVVSAIVGLIGGTAAGAWLTGWLTIRQKRIARRQKKRADSYVEALAWIKSMMTSSPGARSAGSPGSIAGKQASGLPDPAAGSVSPITDAKFLYAVPSDGDIGLDSRYFLTLRSQVIAFGSHDMARAFDRWVYAYRKVLAGEGDEAWDLPVAEDQANSILNGMKFHTAIFPNEKDPIIGTTDPIGGDPGYPENKDGCLTRAVECCASYELRLG